MEIHDVSEFLRYFERVRGRTLRVIDRIPDGRMEWHPEPGAFSFGDLIRHLGAIERWMFAENVALRPSRYPGHGPEVAEGHDGPRAHLEAMHREAMVIFGALSADDLRARCVTPGGAEIPVWKWLRAMIEHEVHHRGQIYLMLRLIGVATPPLYGMTSEEVKDHSEA